MCLDPFLELKVCSTPPELQICKGRMCTRTVPGSVRGKEEGSDSCMNIYSKHLPFVAVLNSLIVLSIWVILHFV